MFKSNSEFEDEVRRIARLLWPSASFGGARILEQRERDGIFESDEFINCIECTTSRGLAKAESDAEKLSKLVRQLRPKYPLKFIKGWFITLSEPTPDQREAVHKYRGQLVTCSYDQFRQKLFDSRSFLQARKDYPFGSIRHPATGSTDFVPNYIETEILNYNGSDLGIEELAKSLLNGNRFALTGDYGSGKSVTARELFLHLSTSFWNNESYFVPVFLNLRDHHGQTDPVEALERHARNIGFDRPHTLVRAWRAGYCLVILDGFDEIASAGWAGQTKKLRDLRYRSMELVRRFVKESSKSSGFLVSGREFFFDSKPEMSNALGLAIDFQHLFLTEFSRDQTRAFLDSLGWFGDIPEWIPTRPLVTVHAGIS
jgi:hypothetical protein